MKLGFWLAAAALAFVPVAASSAVVQFAAPAGNLPAGHLRNAVYDAVLPSGRIVTPLGASVVTGAGAFGLTLTPDGRYAVVGNDDERAAAARSSVDAQILGGSSIAVVDTATLRVVDRFAFPGETYFAGVVAVRDPRAPGRTLVFAAGGARNVVDVFDLDANGHITPDLQHVIALGSPAPAGSAVFAQPRAVKLVAARDGRRVYVVDAGVGSVTAIDTQSRAVSGSGVPAGFEPFGAGLAGDRLLVANQGLMRYARVDPAPLRPAFAAPPPDAAQASSLSLLGLTPDGDFAPGAVSPSLAMDAPPDGIKIAGGAHPTEIAITPDAGYAFVAMTNVDRIATVGLGAAPRVVGGTELRLFDRGPYGTQPAALALSQDGTRLYVALAGLNAIAVLDARDPVHLHRLGLLPTGWFPTALALSADDRFLYALNTKGFGHDLTGDPSTVWSTLQKIDLSQVMLSATTFTTLKNTRETRPAAPLYPHALRNVVVILQENKTFDAMLGDLGYGPADPSLVRFGETITPNMHALARRYAVAGNFYADAEQSDTGHAFVSGGIATLYAQRTAFALGGGTSIDANDDPEAMPRAGTIFNNLLRHHVSFRDYGDLVRLSGYDDGAATDPRVDDPAFAGIDDRLAPTQGLGGRYTTDVPGPAALLGHVDLDYPGWNLRIRDERRAHEFIRDYTLLVAAHRQPRFTHIWLPADHTGSGADVPSNAEQVADGDRALGTIVAYLSRLHSWKNTAIFVLPDDARDCRDHVDPDRSYALVISPYAKPHYVGMHHLSTVSVLKSAEHILALPPLALGDLLATDMSDYFGSRLDLRPFDALPVPAQTAGAPAQPAAGPSVYQSLTLPAP